MVRLKDYLLHNNPNNNNSSQSELDSTLIEHQKSHEMPSMESMFCLRQIYAMKYCSLRKDKNLSKISRFFCANVKHTLIHGYVTTPVLKNDVGILNNGLDSFGEIQKSI